MRARFQKVIILVAVLVVVPAALGWVLAGAPAAAAVPVGVIVTMVVSSSAGRAVAGTSLLVLMGVGFAAALTATGWWWVLLIAGTAGVAGWLIDPRHPVGLGAAMLNVTLIACTTHQQPDLRSALIFGVFIGVGGAAGMTLAAVLARRNAAPQPPAMQLRIEHSLARAATFAVAVGASGTIGVALGWDRAYWVPMTTVVLGQAVLAQQRDRIPARVVGTVLGTVVVVPLLGLIAPTAAYGIVGLIVLIVALTIGTTPYWRFSMLLSASIVMLLAPDASSAINGVGGQRLWGTCIGAAVVASVVWLAGRRAANLSTGARNITP